MGKKWTHLQEDVDRDASLKRISMSTKKCYRITLVCFVYARSDNGYKSDVRSSENDFCEKRRKEFKR